MKDLMERLTPMFEADDGKGAGNNSDTDTEKKGNEGQEDDKKKQGEDKANEKKYSDADVDRILDKKFAAWQKKQEEEISEAKKLAAMDEKQKADYERQKLEEKIEALEKEKTHAGLTREARKILSSEGVKVSDELLDHLIGTDAETTQASVNGFITAFKAAVDDGIKEALKGKTPPAGGKSTLTKSDILKVQDRAERQKLINEHLDLFQGK